MHWVLVDCAVFQMEILDDHITSIALLASALYRRVYIICTYVKQRWKSPKTLQLDISHDSIIAILQIIIFFTFYLFYLPNLQRAKPFSVVEPDSEQLAPSSGLKSQLLLFQ